MRAKRKTVSRSDDRESRVKSRTKMGVAHAEAELPKLRRALSDVAALSALPALWVNGDEEHIAETLSEALLSVLQLDAICVRIRTDEDQLQVRRIRSDAPSDLREFVEQSWDVGSGPHAKRIVGGSDLRGMRASLGVAGDSYVYAISARQSFPTAAESLALSMAANLAAVAVKRAAAERNLRAQTEAVSRLNKLLANERNRLKRLFEEAPGFMALLSGPEHVFEMCNASYIKLAGQRDYIGRSVRDVFPDLEGQGFFELLDEAYLTGQPYVASAAAVDLRRTPDGPAERRYVDFVYQPVFDEHGAVTGIFAEGHDVTEQTRAAEHRQLLINELNHRVKNTLATVQSMAYQSLSHAESVAAAKATLTARLLALSSTHDVLTRESWRSANLSEIVAEAMSPHSDAHQRRISAAGVPLEVTPQTALAVSMALHELATNAIKYGALSNDAGEVTVRWSVASDNQFKLEWRETDGPRILSPPTRRGFGSRLLTGLALELGSSASIDYASTGVVCELRGPFLKASAVQDSPAPAPTAVATGAAAARHEPASP
jgi:two-component sensor histidine kinase